MKKVLYIIASPRGVDSRTLRISDKLIEGLEKKHDKVEIDSLDLFKESLPEMNITRVDGKYALMSGEQLEGEALESWAQIKSHVERFLAADIIVLSTPMWNFSVPYVLKHYIDIIVQPGYMFKYTESGPVGLAGGRDMFIVTSRGGDYSKGSPAESYDKLEPYLHQVFSFIGFKDIKHIAAQPMDAATAEFREEKIAEAIALAQSLV